MASSSFAVMKLPCSVVLWRRFTWIFHGLPRWMVLCLYFLACAHDTSYMCVSVRMNQYICYDPTIALFPEIIAFFIPHDFAQSSISDMFQHRYHVHIRSIVRCCVFFTISNGLFFFRCIPLVCRGFESCYFE